MDINEEEVWLEWMNDESGKMDLCQFCIDNINHPLGSECTKFRWNGKTVKEVYPNGYNNEAEMPVRFLGQKVV